MQLKTQNAFLLTSWNFQKIRSILPFLFYLGEGFSGHLQQIKSWVKVQWPIPELNSCKPIIVHWLCNFLQRGTKSMRIKLAKSSNAKALLASQGGITIFKFHRKLSSHLFKVYYRPSTLLSTLYMLCLLIIATIL